MSLYETTLLPKSEAGWLKLWSVELSSIKESSQLCVLAGYRFPVFFRGVADFLPETVETEPDFFIR